MSKIMKTQTNYEIIIFMNFPVLYIKINVIEIIVKFKLEFLSTCIFFFYFMIMSCILALFSLIIEYEFFVWFV